MWSRVCSRVSVGSVWDGEQSLLVLLPHDEHLQQLSGKRKRSSADKRLTSEREREVLWECVCVCVCVCVCDHV